MAKLISQTYGEALVELAVEENKTDDFIAEITMLLEVLEENKEFGELMNHPKIVKEEKKKVTHFLPQLGQQAAGGNE